MASSTGVNAPPVTMEAKMIVATGHDHCQQLKDMLSKADPSTMVVVMASSNQTSTPKPHTPVMDSRLLAAACSGSSQDLESLLNGENLQASREETIGSSVMRRASGDEEAFLRESLLDAVTVHGDTLLHVVAASHDYGEDFLKKARIIHIKAQNLLLVQTNKGDTPLHCAARAGNSQMVSLLIDLAKGQDNNPNRLKALLETENKAKETALHEVVRFAHNDIVKLLMEENHELASLPKHGTSPLYLAILLENKIIAKTIYEFSKGFLSYSGPNGQNALHAAVLRGKDLTKMLLEWNIDLTIQRDEKGNTPLHFAAAVEQRFYNTMGRSIRLHLLKANSEALYQSDHNGSFPTHVAASIGATWAIRDFLKKSLNCAGLRDARGRTFLHVAVGKMNMTTVYYACRNRSLSWILNMQDNDGNTALHLAVKAGSLRVFCPLFGNRQVQLNLTNEKGETPLDIAYHNLPKRGIYYNQNSEAKIQLALEFAGAKRGVFRMDYFEEYDIVQARQDEKHQMEMVKDMTQNLCIGSVLIATVTFGASFAMPGGYRADDHTNGGTPTLAGRYAFDAFTLANAHAFTLSTMAIISLMSSGSPLHNTRTRKLNLRMAFYFMLISITSLVVAFAIGIYMMLAPVAHKTAVAVCVLSSLALFYQNLDFIVKNIVLIGPLCMRKGIAYTFILSTFSIMSNVVLEHWPILVIFCSTGRNYH
ncbi:hypothetical protein CFC21_090510 [Triticum aestivum]|uniref:PGG domain-containing protein n=2 Tax=Triticum aestivum TaxID=4565 RepID=A0A9R1LED0_WHEAT|nr:ankyrin-2-like [Triticum aestivum]KAF7087309.1 hypothetical protein CFC21_090510 [Triticum aestivum]